MSGCYITKQQVKLYMKYRQENQLTQVTSAAKTGMSARSGYTIEQGKHHTQRPKRKRQHKTRISTIDQVWENELLGMLESNPDLQPMTLFIHLQRTHCHSNGKPLYDKRILRTLQRRVSHWKATHGPAKDVIFPQQHQPGQQGLSDFTHMGALGITINQEAFPHLLYHFRLVYSKWSHVSVIQGGESFQALSEGLQQALQALGGAPNEHRTDSLSAAYKNRQESTIDELTERYEALCQHYGMTPTRNNKGVSHENGSVESSHGHLKNRIAQELILRGSCNFKSVAEYERWVQEMVANSNRRNSVNITLEKQHLNPLPQQRSMDYELLSIKVSNLSMIVIRNMTYSVPSRLAGHTLTVHLYQTRIELYLGSAKVSVIQRQYKTPSRNRYVIDYRHVIHALVKKPGAFRYCKYRDELIPNPTYKCIWQHIDETLNASTAPKLFLRLLKLAADYDCEESLGHYVMERIKNKHPLHIVDIESRFNTSNPVLPAMPANQHALATYDRYIPNTSTMIGE